MENVEIVELTNEELGLVSGGVNVFNLEQFIHQFQMGQVDSVQSYVNSAIVVQG